MFFATSAFGLDGFASRSVTARRSRRSPRRVRRRSLVRRWTRNRDVNTPTHRLCAPPCENPWCLRGIARRRARRGRRGEGVNIAELAAGRGGGRRARLLAEQRDGFDGVFRGGDTKWSSWSRFSASMADGRNEIALGERLSGAEGALDAQAVGAQGDGGRARRRIAPTTPRLRRHTAAELKEVLGEAERGSCGRTSKSLDAVGQ